MGQKRIKLVYFSLQNSQMKSMELERGKFALFLLLALTALFIVNGLILFVFTNIYHNLKISSLRKENVVLGDQLSKMEKKVVLLESHLRKLEEKDNELRLVADLPKIDNDVRNVGVGGLAPENEDINIVVLSETSRRRLNKLQLNLDKLEREILLEIDSYKEIERKLTANRRLIRHTPSLKPVLNGRLTSGFGLRLDPFLERYTFHKGIDLAARRGTPVYATADGIVEEAGYRRGYGKTILINHGYGFKTRYAHLLKIFVNRGQKVRRWDVIGEVGDTGRATAPHLHYEVVVNGDSVDPLNYIYNW